MPAAAVPIYEKERLAALDACRILDTPDEQRFDDLTLLAAKLAGVPISLVSLVDKDRQWFKSRVGVDATETPRDQAFCAHAILNPTSPLVVPDATRDRRFADNPLVTDKPGIRFYAGVPLLDDDQMPLGTLCVIDTVPRVISQANLEMLDALARQASAQLQLTRLARELHERNRLQERDYKCMVEYKSRLEESVVELERLSTTDTLTGLYNRRAFNQHLVMEFDRSRRYGSPMALVMMDIDHFKHINDRYGHPTGDEVLEQMGGVLRAAERISDLPSRFGGEEFALLLPNTDAEAAHHMAERLRTTVESRAWPCAPVTVSIGVTSRREDDTHQSLLSRGDRALYAAKAAGRNCCVVY